MKTLEEIRLADIMPGSITKDGTVSAAAGAIDPQLKAVSGAVDNPAIYSRLEVLPGEMLDNLAAQYDVTAWRESWNLQTKRAVLKTAIRNKRKVGTVSAVKDALESIGAFSNIVEWWQKEPKGTPHTFSIYVSLNDAPEAVSEDVQTYTKAMIDAAKPLRSHYDLVLVQRLSGGMGIYGEVRTAVYRRIN